MIDLERERLTLTKVAKLLDLDVSTVSRWCTRGIKIGVDDAGDTVRLKLPSFRFGGRKCVYRDDLETFLAAPNAGGEEDDSTPAKAIEAGQTPKRSGEGETGFSWALEHKGSPPALC